jgi:hypothetical protein
MHKMYVNVKIRTTRAQVSINIPNYLNSGDRAAAETTTSLVFALAHLLTPPCTRALEIKDCDASPTDVRGKVTEQQCWFILRLHLRRRRRRWLIFLQA